MSPSTETIIANSAAVADLHSELSLTRTFDAPRHLVFEAWTQPEHLKRWFMAHDFTMAETSGEVRPGGAWRAEMRASDGEMYCHGGTYREVVPNERLVFTHAWEDDDGQPEHETIITVSFEDAPAGGTLMTFHQGFFRSVESRDKHIGGWTQFFDRLAAHVAGLVAV